MYAKNRRLERDQRVLEFLESKNLIFNEIYNYSEAENDGIFLEGTGSMVLDRINKKAYCSLSERTDCGLLIEFCEDFKYIPIIFNSYHNEADNDSNLLYESSDDIAQGTGFQMLQRTCGIDNDMCTVGKLHLFNPSNTTFVKHFISTCNGSWSAPGSSDGHGAG